MAIKNNIKLAIVIDNLSIGNIATFAINTAHAAVETGAEVLLICGRAKKLERLPQKKCDIAILPGINGLAHFWSTYRAKKELEVFKPTTILYVHSKLFTRLKKAHHNTVPCLFALLNYVTSQDVTTYLPKRKSKLPYKIITVSESLRESLVNDTKINKDKINVINTGVDTQKFKMKKRNLGQNSPVIGTVGHLIPSKGHNFFIEAAKKIHKRFPDALFIIAGKGKEKTNLKSMVEDYGIIDSVIFVDETHSTTSLLHTFDIYVVPSTEEGLGFAIIEAMSCGLPVVASDVGGIYTLVKDNETGFLVPPKDSDSMANKICYLLENTEIRYEFSAASRDYIKRNHSLEIFAKNLFSVIEGIQNEE